jgi:hypothetical protein
MQQEKETHSGVSLVCTAWVLDAWTDGQGWGGEQGGRLHADRASSVRPQLQPCAAQARAPPCTAHSPRGAECTRWHRSPTCSPCEQCVHSGAVSAERLQPGLPSTCCTPPNAAADQGLAQHPSTPWHTAHLSTASRSLQPASLWRCHPKLTNQAPLGSPSSTPFSWYIT